MLNGNASSQCSLAMVLPSGMLHRSSGTPRCASAAGGRWTGTPSPRAWCRPRRRPSSVHAPASAAAAGAIRHASHRVWPATPQRLDASSDARSGRSTRNRRIRGYAHPPQLVRHQCPRPVHGTRVGDTATTTLHRRWASSSASSPAAAVGILVGGPVARHGHRRLGPRSSGTSIAAAIPDRGYRSLKRGISRAGALTGARQWHARPESKEPRPPSSRRSDRAAGSSASTARTAAPARGTCRQSMPPAAGAPDHGRAQSARQPQPTPPMPQAPSGSPIPQITMFTQGKDKRGSTRPLVTRRVVRVRR